MVLYLDTSALLKRYVAEPESKDVNAKMDEATAIATALITRAEVAAALRTAIDIRLPSASRRSPFSAASGARHTAR